MPKILVIDGDRSACQEITHASGETHISTVSSMSVSDGLEKLKLQSPEMLIIEIDQVLPFADGNQARSAQLLGIRRGKVRDRVKQFGSSPDKKVSLDE